MPFPAPRAAADGARAPEPSRRSHRRCRGDVRPKAARLRTCATRSGRGDRIAITAGSRGIGGFIELLAGIADAVKACGGEPFIIPAMGSHGGATAEGQTEILRRLGVNRATAGAPIRATMETHELGVPNSGASRTWIDSPAKPTASSCSAGRRRTRNQPANSRRDC